jgi:hypothetical protein
MTSYTVTISEGVGGYISSAYASTGYITAQTSMTETIGRTYAASRTPTQTLTLSESIQLAFLRNISQTITNVNIITRLLRATRELKAGTGGYVTSGYTASGYLVDNITRITETLTRVRDVPRNISQTVTLSDTISRLYAALRTLSPTITISDSISRLYDALRIITPSITISETISRLLTASRTVTQTLSITELFISFKGVAGEGARRLKTAATTIFKRVGVTSIFRRSANTTA